MTIASPLLFGVTLGMTLAASVLAIRRRAVPLPALAAIVTGMLLLSAAAGGIGIRYPHHGEVVVMVDVSPSTRGAAYRDRESLASRARQLLGNSRYRVYFFGEKLVPATLESALDEMRADRTIFDPPGDAEAILLFSDGQFALPEFLPPTYVVIDQELERPADARVRDLAASDAETMAFVANTGSPRRLTLGGSQHDIGAGAQVITQARTAAGTIQAELSPGDQWPENDALAIVVAPASAERWWVGASPPPGFVALTPARLPSDPIEFLRPAVIVLDNLPAEALSPLQQDRLAEYVRDFGGSLVILGGDRAFAAGGYIGTTLDKLSPLASAPPQPRVRWILLADSSGSMAGDAGEGRTRWQVAADALVRSLPGIPGDDPIDVGDFARDLRWWMRNSTAREITKRRDLVPQVDPTGPTNLLPALRAIVDSSDGKLPTQVLIISDGDAKLESDLAPELRAKRIAVNLLATAELDPVNPVRKLVLETGGQIVSQTDPRGWADAARKLLQARLPDPLINQPATVRFDTNLPLVDRPISSHNAAWAKADSTAVATLAETKQPVIARWNVGLGEVIAAGFAASEAEAAALAELVARPPKDPRFVTTWVTGAANHVTVVAVDNGGFMNDLRLMLNLDGKSRPIPQTAPGRYELSFPASRAAAVATITLGGALIDHRALAGRYAAEFDAIGTNRAVLQELASRSGGKIIEPSQRGPIDFRWPVRSVSLVPWLAALGGACIAGGLVHWRRGT